MNKVSGIHSVSQALRAGVGQKLEVRIGKLNARQQAVVTMAESLGCPVEATLQGQDESADQGVSLAIRPPAFRSEQELTSFLKRRAQAASADPKPQGALLLVLDGVTDPRNFGACLRSAATFGADAVILPKDRSAPLNEAAIKTASGAASLMPLFRVVNLSRALEALKKQGIWVVGTALDDAQPLGEIDLKGDIAVVMGAEGDGIRQKTRDHCDFLARIPMNYPDLTLNVSVATGICLYEAQRQRNA